ncbi:MAG: transcriptional regulator [Azospirillum brasilense]|uniref:ImmA/IrrE family metallo-endopeptidase n=1 Tax=Roseomonas mucosa TaxID=207340 RepID=UPI000DB8A33C|nr:ImmA/IrrE family metallo-endopeptidase [Roseomonas mucosa]PZP41921.1 MAG: transcriptional regulator [Azospirillum brasilense]QDD97044.1 Transcriptional regulator [Roseomonas mucosa]
MLTGLEGADAKVIGDRLRAARARAGLTQEDAANALGLARTTLVAIEKGQRRVRPDELRAAAKAYRTSASALLRPEAVQVDVAPRFRAVPGVKAEAAAEAGALLADLAAAEAELERLVGRPLRPNYPAERPIGPGDVVEQARDAAAELRHRLGLGLAPVPDPIGLLELELGMRVFVRPLGGAVSGAFLFDESVGACVLLNRNHPPERRLQTALHEVGHFVSARHEPDVVDLERAPQTKEERFAKAFGLEFSMPASLVRRRFQDMRRESGRFSPRHLILLARYFHVSEEAMCRRLEDLGLLPEGLWDTLKERGFSTEHVRQVIGDSDAERRDAVATPRLWLLATEAYRRGLLSEGQLARMLRMDRLEIRAMLDALGGEAEEDDLGSLAPI